MGQVERRIFWRRLDGPGLDQATMRIGADGGGASGASVAVVDGEGFAVRWHVVWDTAWRTRAVRVERLDVVPSLLDLAVDEAGVWRDAGGREVPALEGCLDVDIACTPFTNTLPLRRLGLGIGASATIRVGYIALPGMAASCSVQRYILEAPDLVTFEVPDTGFRSRLRLDDQKLVLHYDALFERVPETRLGAAP